jgi:exo-beta-1,3-glucanase (GH17 family)
MKTNPLSSRKSNELIRRIELMRLFMPFVLLSVSLVSVLTWWWLQGQPQTILDNSFNGSKSSGVDIARPESRQGIQIQCVSYAPFRRQGASPFIAKFKVSKSDIEEDLRLVKKVSSCVRTYGISGGLDQVPQVARELGMKVRLGAWISKDSVDNQRELDQAIALTKSHSDVIELLVVGNEVLLRKELLASEIIVLLNQVKARTSTPITYADVWEFWRSSPEIASHVDNIAIHILPYWEDEPVAAPEAVEHVFTTFTEMRKVFPTKTLWIAETGWPAAGRQRRGAVPDAATQQQFVRKVTERARREKVDVNIIEAFDQPWKRALEGAMGGAWGIFDANGNERIPTSSSGDMKYVRDKSWWRGWVGALLGSVFIGLSLALALRLQRFDKAACMVCGAIVGALAPAQVDFISVWARTPQETILALVNALIIIVGSISLTLLGSNQLSVHAKKVAQIAWMAMLFCTAAAAIVMVADPRYRGFALGLYALPAIVSLASLTNLKLDRYLEQAKFLSLLLVIASGSMLYQEKIDNTQAVLLFVYWLCVALPVLFVALRSRPLIATSPANSKAMEQSSAV